MILGVVLAGGQSSRFGSDKALAKLEGQSLLELAVKTLSTWCKAVVVVGRAEAPGIAIADWPRAGCGPLGGIAAGMLYAKDQGFSSILTCGVDSVDLPKDLLDQLSPPPSYLASQPIIGLWPIETCKIVQNILMSDGAHSMFAFAQTIGAQEVISDHKPANINTPADLAAMEKRHGL